MDEPSPKRRIGRPYTKGQVANPAGRPRGIPDRRTKYRELIESRMPELIERCVSLALQGDMQALRLCIERVLPLPRAEELHIDLGRPLAGTLSDQGREIVLAMSSGAISPTTASSLMGVIATLARVVEVDELVGRIEALEKSPPDGRSNR